MKQQKTTVTIGIPAHNEQENIANLLNSLIKQKFISYRIDKIIVACDGCTDNTAQIVKKFTRKYSKVKLINDGQRVGQGTRLENFYKSNGSDIFITFDADGVLADEFVVEKIVRCFENKKIGLVGGCDLAIRGKTFWQRVVVAKIDYWYFTRRNVNNGNNIHNHHGAASAIRGSIARKISYPKNVVANDIYLFLACKKLKADFCFAQDAYVYYPAPDNLRDFLKQSSRFYDSGLVLHKLYGNFYDKLLPVPIAFKLKAAAKMLITSPFYFLIAAFFNYLIIGIYRYFIEDYSKGVWTTVSSTKQGVS